MAEDDVSCERVLDLLDGDAAAAMAGGVRDGGKSFLERSNNSSDGYDTKGRGSGSTS